ncbi:MAG TPA: choice-of-anchor D domain-containing protein, partial [Flavisolibacter sp.]
EDGTTWVGGIVPTNSQNAIVNHIVAVNSAITRDAATVTTVNTTGSLVINSNTYTNNGSTNVLGSFQINSGWANGNNFTYGAAGTLIFNYTGNYVLNNTDVFWPAAVGSRPFNVKVMQNGITLASNMSRTVDGLFYTALGGVDGVRITSPGVLLLNGTCQIDTGGFFFGNSPTYGSASTLKYTPGATYGRAAEWTHNGVGTIGVTPGYPNNVWLTNTTILDYNNGTPLNKAMAGNLTIDLGSSFYMDYGGGASGGYLAVGGNVINGGILKLGNAVGDDLRIAGNFTNTGTFDGNNRAVIFTKPSGTQIISSTSALTFPYVVFDNVSGSRTAQLTCDLLISAPAAGTALAFGSASDIFDINGRNLIIGTTGIANVITGAGTFKGSTTSNLSLLGTGSIGTLSFTTGFQNLGNLTVNRTSGATGAVLGSALTVNTNPIGLTLTNGRLDVGNNSLTIGLASGITSTSVNYVIADIGSGAGASLRKLFSAAGSFVYPIGDSATSADGSQYSPITVSFAGGSYAGGAYAGVAVNDLKHPNFDSVSQYITRYWSVATSGITVPTSFTAVGTYLDVDVNAPAFEANYQGNKWNGTAWSNLGSPGGAATNSTLNVPCVVNTTNEITSGLRDPDINVYSPNAASPYASGTTYNFGTILIGNSNPVTFTIQNIGQQSLTLTAATFTGGPAYVYTTAYPAGSVSTNGTVTFVVTFTPTVAGTFTGSISIPSNDPNESPYIINFTGVGAVPAPEMNVVGAGNSIADGDTTPVGFDNTSFGTTTIGATINKSFDIQNLASASAVLNLTGAPTVSIGGTNPGDFVVTTVPAVTSLAVGASTSFTITFTPQASGTRTAMVSIANNDSDENPYNFLIQGTGTCAAATNTITPLSGPVNTEVTITATANNLTGATVTFNGISAVVIPVSSTQIKVIVPAGATTGNLVTTNAQGCTAYNTFTVIENAIASCQGGPPPPTDLFLSEVTDANIGGLTYVEMYNPTATSINLSAGGYQLQVANNGGAYSYTLALTGTVASGSTYVVALGDDNACTTP